MTKDGKKWEKEGAQARMPPIPTCVMAMEGIFLRLLFHLLFFVVAFAKLTLQVEIVAGRTPFSGP